MSNKSNPTNQLISLPRGGGALQGIGEKFSPDLHTGTGNFTVPIALPPGRNGLQPQLNLVYSTGSGNGLFGLGWSLSIPGISRKTSKGIPHYDDDKDTFILSGAEDLVPVSGGQRRVTRYRPRTEGLFARIEHFVDALTQDNHWEVRSKDGLISTYGTRDSIGNEPAVITKPGDPTRIFAWKLTETRDPFSNVIEYEYLRDKGSDGSHEWSQPLLRQVRYADYQDQGQTKCLVSVTFEYEDRLTDPFSPEPVTDSFSEYRSGFEIRTTRRCTRIEVRTHAGTDRLVRTYELIYLDQRADLSNLKGLLPLNRVSLLSRIKVTGHDGNKTEQLPPLDFGYTQFTPETRDFFPITGPEMPPFSLAHPDYELVDLIGNGLQDILEMNGTVRYWRNLGGGRFDLPREMAEAPAGLRLAESGVQMLDADGDGRMDLLVTTPAITGYFPLQFGALWNKDSFRRYERAPSFNLEDPEVRLVDLDGDGITDVIRSGARFECYFNDQHRGWTDEKTRRVERQALDIFPNVNFSDPRVKWSDMTGDGLQDIVLIHNGSVQYWPNLGRGEWGKPVFMRNSPRYGFGYDPKRVIVGDVDGDGLADLVYVEDTQVTLWINRSGNAWSDPILIAFLGTPPVTDMGAVRLVDMLGSGVSGVLWSSDAGGLSRDTMFFLDFTGGTKPYLLSEMNNHLGAVTNVSYKSSTYFYLEDDQQLATRWKTPLPFPVQVVAKVEVTDEMSRGKLTTEYCYHHGYWDGAEREFRGFGRVEHLDTEDTPLENVRDPHRFSPPTLTKTWFHCGPVGEEFGEWTELAYGDEFWPGDSPLLQRSAEMGILLNGVPRRVKRDALRTLRGSILRTELYALDGTERRTRPYTVIESQYAVSEVLEENGFAKLSSTPRLTDSPDNLGPPAHPLQTPRIFFPHVVAQRTTQWERGDDPMTQFTFTGEFDNFGQPQKEIRIACPRGWRRVADRPTKPYLATLTKTDHARPDPNGPYIYDRVAGVTTYELGNSTGKTVVELHDLGVDNPHLGIINQTFNYYDGPAFTGLPRYQDIGDFGALVRTETLVLTDELIRDGYASGNAGGPRRPPYLNSDAATPVWTNDYPQDFRAGLPQFAGYEFADGTDHRARGFFAQTDRRKYDFQSPRSPRPRGLVEVTQDPLGHKTLIEYDDPYQLLKSKVTDPVELVTAAEYDYRVLQPKRVTDPNGNQTEFKFSPMGLLSAIWVRGKQTDEGDHQRPSVQMKYDFLAFFKSPPDTRRPIFVRTLRQCNHDTETDVPAAERNKTIETREFSDGFGRLLQTRAQGEEDRFGDPAFGGDVLPPDQDDRSGTRRDVVGTRNTGPRKPNVVVSGWQIYDNKGQVVEKFEPFFSEGWDYATPDDDQRGQKITMHYDPRGHVIRTVNPDGSEQRIVQGVPGTIANPNLTNPDDFEPTPWEAFTYDPNDAAPLSFDPVETLPDGSPKPLDHRADAGHHFTPASILVDALGRAVQRIERNGPAPATDRLVTRSTYDIQGRLLNIIDPLGRTAFRHVYDLPGTPLRIESIDAGVRRRVADAAGNLIEQRDSKGAMALRAYDELNRPKCLWARDNADGRTTLREKLIYGDQVAAGLTRARSANLLGKLHKHFDESGVLTFEKNDFKGNVLEKSREVIHDSALKAALDAIPPSGAAINTFRVDWDNPPALEGSPYLTSFAYDALNRLKALQYPKDVDGRRQELRPRYNRAGALESVALDDQTYVERIAYNSKGQRTLVAHGNGVMTRYAYDAYTFRLIRLRSERYAASASAPLVYSPNGGRLQDFAYAYDLVGNILYIRDRAPGCGVQNSAEGKNALTRTFEYDALYRLIHATGRESTNIDNPRPWEDLHREGFNSGRHGTPTQDNAPQLTRLYWERYEYDPAGNMLSLQHNGGWTRYFGMAGFTPSQWRNKIIAFQNGGPRLPEAEGNRLTNLGTRENQGRSHEYDENGNLTREHTSRHFAWDHADRLIAFAIRAGTSGPASVAAYYLYDASGQRVKKYVRNQQVQVNTTVYVDAAFEHHRQTDAGGTRENNTLHVMDNKSRVATVRVGAPLETSDASPRVQYHLGDHLGSSHVVLGGDDATANNFINREEYFPYSETSFGSFAHKRYRYSGKERDEETGLYYYGARYYAPWLGRWTSCDPAGTIDGPNIYTFVKDNPVRHYDAGGRSGIPVGVFSQQSQLEVQGRSLLQSAQAFATAITEMQTAQSAFDEAVKVASAASEKYSNRQLDVMGLLLDTSFPKNLGEESKETKTALDEALANRARSEANLKEAQRVHSEAARDYERARNRLEKTMASTRPRTPGEKVDLKIATSSILAAAFLLLTAKEAVEGISDTMTASLNQKAEVGGRAIGRLGGAYLAGEAASGVVAVWTTAGVLTGGVGFVAGLLFVGAVSGLGAYAFGETLGAGGQKADVAIEKKLNEEAQNDSSDKPAPQPLPAPMHFK